MVTAVKLERRMQTSSRRLGCNPAKIPWQVPRLEVEEPEEGFNLANRDGAPIEAHPKFIRFELLHCCLPLILPAAAPLLPQPIP